MTDRLASRLAEAAKKYGSEWRIIPGYEGYAVSRDGRIVSFLQLKLRLKRTRFNCQGYDSVGLYQKNSRKTRLVHGLVLEAFVGPCPAGHQADHIDHNRVNNRLENLRWIPYQENLARRRLAKGSRAGSAKLTEPQVYALKRISECGVRNVDLAMLLEVDERTIGKILNGDQWTHVE